MHDLLLAKAALIVFLGIAAQWFAWRFRLPAIVLLCVAGILVGPVFNLLSPSEDLGEISRLLVRLSVAFILFDGGLNLRQHELKEAGRGVRRMIIFGLPLSWILASIAAHYIGGLSLPVSVTLGAILTVTGPTVIIPLIRQARLNPRVASLLKWEGIINDPIGVLLAVLVFDYFIFAGQQSGATLAIFIHMGIALAVAVATGLGSAYFLKVTFHNGWIPEFLKVPTVLTFIILVFGLSDFVQEESGLLAVTVFGYTVGNIGFKIIDELRSFKESIAIFLVSFVFIILTADLDPLVLAKLDWRSVAFLVCIVFIVRPAAMWIATMASDLNSKERLLVGWIAPRGVVAASMAGIFAPKMLEAGYPDAELLVPTIFAVIFTTVLLHGFSLGYIARRLGLAHSTQDGILIVGSSLWTVELAKVLQSLKINVILADNSWHRLKDARFAGIDVYHGEVLSEDREQALDVTQVTYLLAATDNDAYNALVCKSLGPHFGRDRVFQLPMHRRLETKDKGVSSTRRGNTAFGDDMRYEKMLSQVYQGWVLQKTPITEAFGLEDLQAEMATEIQPLMVVTRDRRLVFGSSARKLRPEPGDVLISFVAPGPRQKVTATTAAEPST